MLGSRGPCGGETVAQVNRGGGVDEPGGDRAPPRQGLREAWTCLLSPGACRRPPLSVPSPGDRLGLLESPAEGSQSSRGVDTCGPSGTSQAEDETWGISPGPSGRSGAGLAPSAHVALCSPRSSRPREHLCFPPLGLPEKAIPESSGPEPHPPQESLWAQGSTVSLSLFRAQYFPMLCPFPK